MTETPGSGPVWHGEPLVSRTAEPDWAAMANRHEHEVRRRKQLRVAAAGVAGVVAIAGIMATVIQLSGAGHRSASAAAASAAGRPSATTAGGLDGSTSVTVDGSGSPSASAPGGSTAPAAQASAGQTAAATSPGGAAPAPGGGSTPPGGAPAPQQTTSAPAPGGNPAPAPPPPQKPPAPTPTATNPYTPVQACGGGGYFVIDSHALSGATVYLLYNNGTGYNCVVTMATHPSGSVPMNATLAVQGGGSGSNPGSFTDYAGPVTEHAPAACVEWGGSYQGSSWTSGWSHCSR